MTDQSILQVLRFYKKKLMALTECLHDEQVGHSQVQIADDSLDEKLQALSKLAGECFDHGSCALSCCATPPLPLPFNPPPPPRELGSRWQALLLAYYPRMSAKVPCLLIHIMVQPGAFKP